MNIAGLKPIIDPTYRYKMPKLVSKTQSRGNGIKTVITNIHAISRALHRNSEEVLKYLGYTLCSHTKLGDEAVVNGEFTQSLLQDRLAKYIDRFVLCPRCTLPETIYKIKQHQLYHECAACGEVSPIDDDKLTDYLIKHAKKKHAKKKHAKKKRGKKHTKKGPKELNTIDDLDDEDVIWYTDLSEEAVASRALDGNSRFA